MKPHHALLLALASGLLSIAAHGQNQPAETRPLVVLDPGHVPSAPGAISSCGNREVDYNDRAVRVIQDTLADEARILLTRQPGQEVLTGPDAPPPSATAGREPRESLLRRPQIANDAHADFFIAIHHDSTDSQYQVQDPSICDGRGGTRLSDEFKAAHHIGFNIFVYQGDASNADRFNASVRLASLIGHRMIEAGLTASDFHQKPVSDCDSCRPIDAANGVWNEDLAVLKATTMPAILIEAELIIDPQFEAIASSAAFRATLARAIHDGLADDQRSQAPQK